MVDFQECAIQADERDIKLATPIPHVKRSNLVGRPSGFWNLGFFWDTHLGLPQSRPAAPARYRLNGIRRGAVCHMKLISSRVRWNASLTNSENGVRVVRLRVERMLQYYTIIAVRL